MLRQQIKDLLFLGNRWAAIPNKILKTLKHRRGVKGEGYLLHLGCGATYIPGMINADGNVFRKIDLWLDLRNALPFPDRSVRFVYCCHTIEHLFPDEAMFVLSEIRRALKPDGVARIAVPCLEYAMKVARGEARQTFPRPFKGSEAQAINYLFCDGQHKYGYCWEIMETFAREAGFTHVENYSAQRGVEPKEYFGVTIGNEPEGSLVVELRP